MIFQKSSLRTRLGFEAAMAQLGGHAVNLEDHQVGLTKREEVRDVARVISSMCDAIMARVYGHHLLIELAANSTVPIINGLSDWSHPCQALSDVMTIKEHFRKLAGLKLAFVGDGNNVARSVMHACAKTGIAFAIASPEGYEFDEGLVESARELGKQQSASITMTDRPAEAVADADIVYTDVWTSMGQEAEQAEREEAFAGFQVTPELMQYAKPTAMVMHCLPAHRNVEIADEVVDGPQSLIFRQAENRLHSQRALLEVLLRR
jgi:ornithine carbamoyltransferase